MGSSKTNGTSTSIAAAWAAAKPSPVMAAALPSAGWATTLTSVPEHALARRVARQKRVTSASVRSRRPCARDSTTAANTAGVTTLPSTSAVSTSSGRPEPSVVAVAAVPTAVSVTHRRRAGVSSTPAVATPAAGHHSASDEPSGRKDTETRPRRYTASPVAAASTTASDQVWAPPPRHGAARRARRGMRCFGLGIGVDPVRRCVGFILRPGRSVTSRHPRQMTPTGGHVGTHGPSRLIPGHPPTGMRGAGR